MKSIQLNDTVEDIYITVSIDLNDDFTVTNTNEGYIKIESIYKDNKSEIFWDNLNFFINNDKDFIINECMPELTDKKLWEKGMFNTIFEMIDELIKYGYLNK